MSLYITSAEAIREERRRVVKFKPVIIQKRGNSYQLYYYNPRGERRRISVGNDFQQAQRLAVKFNDWLMDGKDPESEIKKAQQEEASKAITLKDFFPVFMERHGIHQSRNMQQIYNYRFKQILRCPSITEISIENITKSLMLDYMHARMKEDNVSAATVNREAALVKSMLFRATEWDILVNNPLQGFKLLPEAEKRNVDISPEQAAELIKVLPEPISSLAEFAIYSGFRKENILSLRIEAICFHDLTSTGEVQLLIKGGRHEIYPLGTFAVNALKRVIKERKEGYVFINPQTNSRYYSIHNTFNRAVKRVGLTVNGKKLRFHDLRHVFATWLLRAGVNLEALRELMGHRNRSTTDRYAFYGRKEASWFLALMPEIASNNKK